MRIALLPLLCVVLLLAACAKPEPPPALNLSVSGWVIGNDYNGKPITVGKNELAGKGLVITYFATW